MNISEKVQRPRRSPPFINRIMAMLLRSPFSRLVDSGIVLLTVFGRRTGLAYTFPVEYVQDGEMLWIFAGGARNKTWWRNLVDGGPVEVLVRGREREGHGVALSYGEDPALVEEGLRRYLARFPKRAKLVGVPPRDDNALREAAVGATIVRVRLEPQPEGEESST